MKKNTRILKTLAVLFVAGVLAVSICNKAVAKNENATICDGVYLDGVYVGGLTESEAKAEYAEYIQGIGDLKLSITTSTGSFETTLSEIGIEVSVENAVAQALHYGRSGNILSRYKEMKTLQAENVVLVPEKSYDKELLKSKLETETADIVTEPKNASIKRENGEFIIEDGVVGTTIKIDDTLALVDAVFAKAWEQKPISIAAVVEEKEPEYTTADFEAIDSVLGDFSTEYNPGNANRSKNLATGASKIDGTVLMPGEKFSMYETVSPFTEENGYANAGQYVEDELVDGLGGGICQVSTTLYNAVLESELEVNERYPHSLTVSYVKLSRDAAIAGDYMDFKFTNNTEYPIYISGYAGGGTISFAVYGHETRPANRTISFESKTIEVYEPEEPVTEEDENMDEGTSEVEQQSHTGYYAELWKHIYEDGVLVDSVRVNQSSYRATAQKIRIGTRKTEASTGDTGSTGDDGGNTNQTTETPTEVPTEPSTPTTEAPTTEAPATEAPATEAPVGDVPAPAVENSTEAPVPEEPVGAPEPMLPVSLPLYREDVVIENA